MASVKALVLNGIYRECLAVVRSLGAHGVSVEVADPNRLNPARFSKYAAAFHRHPDPAVEPDAFLAWLTDRLRTRAYDAVFPIDDTTYEICTAHQDELLRYTRIALNAPHTYEIARDKGRTLQAAEKAGVPIPRSWYPRSVSELAGRLSELPPYPLLMKPTRSWGARGVLVVDNDRDLLAHLEEKQRRYGDMIVQEYIPGSEVVSVPAVFNMQGEVRGALVDRRIRMFPADGGQSVAGYAIRNEALRDQAIRFLSAIGFKGVGQVEFKVDPRDGIPKLMEVNPRFWGTTQIGVTCGIDWPWMLFRILTEGDCPSQFEYRTDKLLRWLIPGEILHLLTRRSLRGLGRDFLRLSHRDTEYYVFRRDDLLPTLGLALTLAANGLDPKRAWSFIARN